MLGGTQPPADANILRRVLGDVINSPSISVATVKSRLRPFDYFYPLDGRGVEALDVALIIHSVDEEGSAGFDARLHTCQHVGGAADYRTICSTTKGLTEADADGLLGEIVKRVESLLRDGISGNH